VQKTLKMNSAAMDSGLDTVRTSIVTTLQCIHDAFEVPCWLVGNALPSRITAALTDAPALPACVQAITIIFQITHYDEHQVHMDYARALTDHPIHLNDLLTYVEQFYSVCGSI